jgi:O-methyltransferase involved in polyketide biosynthesis
MHQHKVMINLSGISKTLLFSLWGRAKLSREHSSLINDIKAIEIVEKIDYDLSTVDMVPLASGLLFPFALRAKHFDDKIKAYIAEYPHASIVNIGAGLDTTFYRVDNGSIHWYDLDLPKVIEIRKQIIPETDRTSYIAKSFLDPRWHKEVKHKEEGVFMLAGGVLMYFEESHVKQFFLFLADHFPSSEIVFDAPSKLSNHFGAWIEQLLPNQQKALRAAWKKALRNWWQNEPQGQKAKLMTMLKTQTKPRSTEWVDLESWWKQLNASEKEEVRHNFRTAFANWDLRKWALEDANEITHWDEHIKVIDQFPLFKNIPRDPALSKDVRKFMDFSERYKLTNIFHLRV